MERTTLDNKNLRNALHKLHIALIDSTMPLLEYRDIETYNEIRKAANRLHQLVSREHNRHTLELADETETLINEAKDYLKQ